MITTGIELNTFLTDLNAGAAIDLTLGDVLVNTARAVIEEERPWIVLRKVDTSLSLTTASTWNTAVSIAGITDFSRFYSDTPIRLFDGNNQVHYFNQVPFDRQLEYKDVSNTFCFDENTDTLYFNGTIPFNGTLHISYIATGDGIDLESDSRVWSPFPARFLPLIGFYAIGIFKGAVDYDSINRQMLPENRAALEALKNGLEKWDNERQLSTMSNNDPSYDSESFRNGAINRY